MSKVFYEGEREHLNVYINGIPDKIYLGMIRLHPNRNAVFFWPDKRGISISEFIQILMRMIKIKLVGEIRMSDKEAVIKRLEG